MATKGIVWVDGDGMVWVTHPNDQTGPNHVLSNPPLPGESEEAYLDRNAAMILQSVDEHNKRVESEGKDNPNLKTITFTRMPNISVDNLPDRDFRESWTHDGKTLSVDIKKARAVHRQRLLDKRDKEVLPEIRKALEIAQATEDKAAEAVCRAKIKRLYLLDNALAQALEAFQTPADLKRFLPADLQL